VHRDDTGLGAVIKAARLEKGFTQETLAEKVGIGPRHMMGIENEGGNPSYKVLYRLVRELGIPADGIFYPEKDDNDSRINPLILSLKQCGDSDIRVVAALVKALLAEREK
jgi:transcriptional regulator with XRE-family HTH domain